MAQTRSVTKTRTELKYPSRYQVVIFNDDQTPMDFVITLLVELFNKNVNEAQALTMQIHEQGKAVAGIYNREVAEQKVLEGTTFSRNSGYPLKLSLEVI